MKKLFGLIIGVAVVCAFAIPAFISCNKKVEASDSARTQLQIFNATDSAVTVWITLGATEGCIQNCKAIPYVTDSLAPLVGSFVLRANDSTIVWSPDSLGFNGNISFNTQPINCATKEFPNGVNMFEFIINNYFQAGNPQETVDISCVAGTSCIILCNLTGGNPWNAGSNYDSIRDIKNSLDNKNSGLIGVFPFGCDTCTGAKNPPSCDSVSTDKQTESICTVQRNAVGAGGGLVKVVYLGQMQPLK